MNKVVVFKLKIWSFQFVFEVFNVTELKIIGEPCLMGLNACLPCFLIAIGILKSKK